MKEFYCGVLKPFRAILLLDYRRLEPLSIWQQTALKKRKVRSAMYALVLMHEFSNFFGKGP
jgi:hypothetical protein